MSKKTELEKSKIKKLLERSGKQDVETRRLKTEFRVSRKEDGALPKIEGYAAVFNSDSEDMGFIERIKPGAFSNAIKISDARALFNHDSNYILGRQSNGTLELKEDKNGLFISVQPPDTQLIRDMVLTPIERGDVTQQSFAFTIEADSWDGLDTDKPVRTIEKVRELMDVSPVVYPAYPDTEVGLRSLETARGAVKDDDTDDKTEDLTITIDKTEYVFVGESRIDLAIEKLTSLKPKSSPTTADLKIESDDVDPTIKTESEETRDDTLDKINETIERLNNENN